MVEQTHNFDFILLRWVFNCGRTRRRSWGRTISFRRIQACQYLIPCHHDWNFQVRDGRLLKKSQEAPRGADQVCQISEKRWTKCKVQTLFHRFAILFRCFLQYDRLYVENEIYLYNEIEQRVERMIIGKKEVEVRDIYFSLTPFVTLAHCNDHY